MRDIVLHFEDSGRLQFVWTDDARPLLSLGTATINRASHVEPTRDCQWLADLAPIGGPVLGPFDSRSEALVAEISAVERRLELGASDTQSPHDWQARTPGSRGVG